MPHKQIPGLHPGLTAGSIYCIGRNYAEHAKELNNEVPDKPVVFLKPASSLIYDGDSIIIPSHSKDVHHEVELVIAIGKKGKYISAKDAQSHIAGYGIGIDVTARDIQQTAKQKGHPWTVAKGFDSFAPVSTFLPASEIEDPGNLKLKLTVNGEERQNGHTSDMIFPVPELIRYLSEIFTLFPGDLIFTGTPAGVSAIREGDHIVAVLDENKIKLSVTVKKTG